MAAHFDIAVLGAGPAGVTAAARAATLGARTALITDGPFGGMAANDGPVPVRTLAHIARLVRDARQLGRHGITGVHPQLDYQQVLDRVRHVVGEVRSSSFLQRQLSSEGVELFENIGSAEFLDERRVRTASGQILSADTFIICTGGAGRTLPIPGFELTGTHSDAWSLPDVPNSMIVLGGGATGLQVASIFNAFGTRVQVFEAGPRILPPEDDDVASMVDKGFRELGVEIITGFGAIDGFEKTATGVRMRYQGGRSAEADVVIAAVGWAADVGCLGLQRAGVEVTSRGFIAVDEYLRTSTQTIYAAGDVTGRILLASEAIRDGHLAADNAVRGPRTALTPHLTPEGGFTDPEYAAVGLTEEQARKTHQVICATVTFDACTRPIIDGQAFGFCKLVVDADSAEVLGCHIVGDHAVDVVQVIAVALAAGLRRVDDIARMTVSFPTYAEILVHTAVQAAQRLGLDVGYRA
ncbi:FAD-dependent oxidoreductase [Mycobacterium sp. 20091114027_K0903767]|nr:FAD-dependent oxidoreductase [Mycobacterium sp. 20091114027_K0903767]